ncbi:MAG: hypothetical protein GEU75_01530 [Dehalococcoidia bacterium]|nr:hypothetical protein [Dehalococcoidia bacterium]
MVSEPVLVLFCGGMGGSPVEDALGQALRECALDTLDEALATGAYAFAVVVTDEASAADLDGRLPPNARLDIDAPGEDFHLGRRLAEVILRHELERPVYIGSGLPLIKGDELAAVASVLASQEAAVVSNNYFSADLVGFVPGGIVRDLELPNNDRALPRLLAQRGGLVNQSLPRTMTNQFDLDTPGDLAILACSGGAGPNLQAYIAAQTPDTRRLAQAAWLFTDQMAEVLVAGRVNAEVFQFLTAETACRTRIYSEERGMQAMERDLNGQARSLLAFHLKAIGPERFFDELAEMVQAAFIDTRPLFSHLGLNPSRSDRFLSDAMQPEGIKDAWLRDFTKAAREAAIPVILGGSTLVASGVQLLSEAAWREHDKLEAEYKVKGRARR